MVSRDLPTTASQACRTFLSHPSPVVLSIGTAVLLGVRIWLGQWTWWDVVIPVALAAWWPMHEWIIHIGLLHARPIQLGRLTVDFKVAKIHRHHHAEPWDLQPTFIPFHIVPLTGIPLTVAAYLLLPANIATTFLLAYITYSLHYEWCHYLAHIDWCPPLAYYRKRVRLHRLHHFHHERLWWGVSTLSADRVLGTAPAVEATARSKTTHDLLAGPWFNHDDAVRQK